MSENRGLTEVGINDASGFSKKDLEHYIAARVGLAKDTFKAIATLISYYEKRISTKRIEDSRSIQGEVPKSTKYEIIITNNSTGYKTVLNRTAIKELKEEYLKLLDYNKTLNKLKVKRPVKLSALSGYNNIYLLNGGVNNFFYSMIDFINNRSFSLDDPFLSTKQGLFLRINGLITAGGKIRHATLKNIMDFSTFFKRRLEDVGKFEKNQRLSNSHHNDILNYAFLVAVLGLAGKTATIANLAPPPNPQQPQQPQQYLYTKATILDAYYIFMNRFPSAVGHPKKFKNLSAAGLPSVGNRDLSAFDPVSNANSIFKISTVIDTATKSAKLDPNNAFQKIFLKNKNDSDYLNLSAITSMMSGNMDAFSVAYLNNLAFSLLKRITKNLAELSKASMIVIDPQS